MKTTSPPVFDPIADLAIPTASVLVVEDSSVVRTVVMKMVRDTCGFAAYPAGNGREALAAIAERLPSIVLTDLNMPEMDGLELVETVKEKYPLIPVILMTGQGSEEIALRALKVGAASYVPKKNIARDLVEVLQQVLAVSRMDRRKQRLLQSLARRESEFVLENDPTMVPLLIGLFQDELTGTSLCSPANRTRIAVALEEALLNAIYHGNLEVSSELKLQGNAFYELAERRRTEAPYMNRRIYVRTTLMADRISYSFRDEGPGFDVRKLPDPTDPASLDRPSGRGLMLIRAFMNEVRFNHSGNEITMVKYRD